MKTYTGQYLYALRGSSYRIYRCDGSKDSASPVTSEPPYRDREKARRRVCELNGWRYKPCRGKH